LSYGLTEKDGLVQEKFERHRTGGADNSKKVDQVLKHWLDLLIPIMVQQYIANHGEAEHQEASSIQERVQ
jgi:hypothetical protein